jgi:broad specificity phosphatase PhoE
MRVYFVRHGESEANTRHVISNRESSFHLTSLGQQQAQTLASGLRDIPFRAVFCSPVLRARETANILSASLNIPCQVTEALREYDCGILEEKSDDESWKLHRYYFNEWMSYRNYESAPEGGENFLDIRNRFVPFIESLKKGHEGDLLLVGHGGLFLLMLPLILMNIENRFVREHGIGHTECIVAESTMDGFICRQWGDVQF